MIDDQPKEWNMMLRITVPEKGHNRFCGPAAVAAITGVNTAAAAYLLRQVSGRRSIKGTWPGEVLRAIGKLGYIGLRQEVTDSPTLAAWAKASRTWRKRQMVLVELTHHFVVVRGRTFADSHGVSTLSEAPCRRARVKRTWIIERQGKVAPSTVIPREYRQPAARARKAKLPPSKEEVRATKVKRVEEAIARWESKARRAENALKKLNRRLRGLRRTS